MTDEIIAGTVTITGNGGDELEAYLAKPTDATPRGGVVVIHHLPGYDKATKEMVRRFAAEGYNALCPNLYTREAPGADRPAPRRSRCRRAVRRLPGKG